MNRRSLCTFAAGASLLCASVHAAITGVVEVNLGADAPAIIATGFGEDTLSHADRTHQHNGAAFNDTTGLLSTSGTVITPLPSYLLGHDYIRFANDARDNVDYSATVTTDLPSTFYLLLDNRLDGPLGNTSSPNSTDPVLGGALQWVLDGGWERVNTGISPNGQADYTAVDESGAANNTVGPGVGLNQFYAVYRHPDLATSITIGGNQIGGSNMLSLVAVAIPEPSTSALAIIGLLGVAVVARRQRT